MTSQSLLTIPLGRIMQVFIEQSRAGNRIVCIAPHWNDAAMLMGYLVVIEPSRDQAVRGETEK